MKVMKIEEDPIEDKLDREEKDQEQSFACTAVAISSTRILVGNTRNETKKKVSSNMMKLIEAYFLEWNEPYSIIWWKIERENYPKIPEDILEILDDFRKDSAIHTDIILGSNKYLNKKVLEDLITENFKLINKLKKALDSGVITNEKKDFYTQYLKRLEATQELCVMKIKEGDDEIEDFLKMFSLYETTYEEKLMLLLDGIISPENLFLVSSNDL